MIRKFIILICICFTVCCAVIGYLSMQVEKEVEVLVGDSIEHTCESLLEEWPSETTGIQLSEFASGKFIADFDFDDDQQWDEVCVPLFPPKKSKVTWGYCAVLVHFKGITNQEQLDALIDSGKLDTNFWPRRQELSTATHSKLAQSYKNLDLSKSIVLHHGYDAENPLLGEATLQLSKIGGAVSLGIAFLTLLTFLFKSRGPKDLSDLEQAPVTNRAGLPVS